MSDWRDKILSKIDVEDSRLIVILDQDNLLADLSIIDQLIDRDFFILPYIDPVSFRLRYEPIFRMKWDQEEKTSRLIVPTRFSTKSQLPFDLQQEGRIIKIGFEDIVPSFNRQVIEKLGIGYFNEIYPLQEICTNERLSESKTKQIILSGIFKISPENIKESVDLFSMLFRIHYNKIVIPDFLVDFIVEKSCVVSEFSYTIKDFFHEKFFYGYVQRQWSEFLDAKLNNKPSAIPFENSLIKPYIITFFIEGLLTPVEFSAYSRLPEWTWLGIIIEPDSDAKRRLLELLNQVNREIVSLDPTYPAWKRMGWKWSEAAYLFYQMSIKLHQEITQQFEETQNSVEKIFADWLILHFKELPTLSYLPKPALVHHIPHYIAANNSKGKIALIVFDGLALHQWFILRDALIGVFEIEEDDIFAWIPTLTSISRRAIFSGKNPFQLKAALRDFESEKRYWKEFWVEHGYRDDDIAFLKGLSLQESSELDDIQKISNKKVIGVIINTVDNLLKNSEITSSDLQILIKRWVDNGLIIKMIQSLKEHGFEIYLTSDHGNIFCKGAGALQEGILTEEKSLRVRIYENAQLAENSMNKVPTAIRWPDENVGSKFSVLLSRGLTAFNNTGETSISHGGISIEEVIVPFIHIDGEK